MTPSSPPVSRPESGPESRLASPTDPLWITEAEVVAALSLPDAIVALERGLAWEGAGQAENLAKTHVIWNGHNTLHALGAVVAKAGDGGGMVGVKSWAHTDGGATPLLTLWDGADGRLLAVIEAFALGQMRTGGIAGVATRRLAQPGADELAVIGSGRQALAQVAAVAAVRRLRRVRVFSPTPENRRAFVGELAALLPALAVEAADTVERAVAGAPIVTLVTRARSPFLTAAMLAPGTHVNAVGAITPERREFTQDVFARTTTIAVDSLASVQALSAEFRERFAADWAAGDGAAVRPLSELVVRDAARAPDADLTLFKAMGMGLSDLALGIEILDRVRRAGGGRPMSQPQRAKPRLVSTTQTRAYAS